MAFRRLLGVFILLVAGCSGDPAQGPTTGKTFSEDFEDHASFPNGWETPTGRWELLDDENAASGIHVVRGVYGSSEGGGTALSKARGTYQDVELRVHVRFPTGHGNAGFVFGYVDAGHHHALIVTDAGNVSLAARGTGGTAHGNVAPFSGSAWTELLLRAVEGTVTLTVGGSSVELHEAPVGVGHVGLAFEGATVAVFDDLAVTVV